MHNFWTEHLKWKTLFQISRHRSEDKNTKDIKVRGRVGVGCSI